MLKLKCATCSPGLASADLFCIGDQYADIPADWFDQAIFNVVASSSCRSTIRANFIVDNHASTSFLVDEDINNNTANLLYTNPITLTAIGQPALCHGTSTGNIVVTSSPGTSITVTNSIGTVMTAPYPAGTYTVTATAGSEAPLTTVCTASTTVTITEPAAISIISATVTSPILCNGGTGTVTIVATGGTAPYSYTFNGQTNTTGVFTGVLAGTNLPYSVTDVNSCSAATGTVTVIQPTGTAPDISLGSDYEANFFPNGSAGTEYTIVYNIAEIGGYAAVGDTLRIIRASGYSISFDVNADSTTIGSTVYPLDNIRWKLDNTNVAFVSLILDPPPHTGPGVLTCSQRVFIAIKFKRVTSNQSTFALSARLRKTNGELSQGNNLNSIVFTAE